jgi:hypothetical protein
MENVRVPLKIQVSKADKARVKNDDAAYGHFYKSKPIFASVKSSLRLK